MSVDWAALTFQAIMPPVVLIHGNGSNGGFWDRRGFTKVLQEKKIPYDNSINLATTTVVTNGASLKNEILAVEQNMGVTNIQIIAHSKGGLDTREFLASHYPQLKKDKKLSVHNFITLSTPHHGAVGADYLEAFRLSRDYELDNPNDRTKFAENMSKNYTNDEFQANRDLTVSKVSDFNKKNKLPIDIKYFSVGADADINSNSTLEENEYKAMEDEAENIPWYAPRSIITKKMNIMYSAAGRFKTVTVRDTGRVTWWKKTPTSSFKQNDMMVTVESAKYNKFNFIQQFNKNHSSVADQEVAREVVKKLKYVK